MWCVPATAHSKSPFDNLSPDCAPKVLCLTFGAQSSLPRFMLSDKVIIKETLFQIIEGIEQWNSNMLFDGGWFFKIS